MLAPLTCISMVGLNSIGLTGNLFSPFHAAVEDELDRRISLKRDNIHNQEYDKAVDEAVLFYDHLIDSMGEQRVKDSISFSIFSEIFGNNSHILQLNYGNYLKSLAKQQVLWSENGVGIELKHNTEYSQSLLKPHQYTGTVSVLQTNVGIMPNIILLEDLKKTHYTLQVPVLPDSTHHFQRQSSYDLVFAIHKKVPYLEIYLLKYVQNIDASVDLYLLVQYIINLLDKMNGTPAVLIDHIFANSGFKRSLTSIAVSPDFSKDIFKLHIMAFFSNAISIAKKQMRDLGGVHSAACPWLNPVTESILSLHSLLSAEKIAYFTTGNRSDLRMHKSPILKGIISFKTFFDTLQTNRHAHSIVKNILGTRHGGISENSIGGSFTLSSEKFKDMCKKIDNLTNCSNINAVGIYYDLANSIAKGRAYNQVFCCEKLLDIPVLEKNNKQFIYKESLHIYEVNEGATSRVLETLTTNLRRKS